ncbi:Hypothetical predicted protein [Octopus vulgaris]|uniref:Uncharacterized protein n=1 Tax=Octopus vulgaris TaxID=6645 RepID=A0AA36FIW0_OCTVU|nr:Hypothetical predicted protein [Octopus vulgaris]
MPTQPRSRPASVYDNGNRMLKVTPDLTGRINSDRRRAMSDMNYNMSLSSRPRSERGSTISRSRSTQDLGAL